jgi:competence protein ComEC
LPGRNTNAFADWLTATRDKTLSILKKYIPGKKESGVAEALLSGYRDDLDRDLVRSYSNTGVVHIIAISGLHLGMIYGLLLFMLKPFRKIKWMRWAKPVIILAILWGFSLLAGAAASILRSVVMFSFIVIGESLGRRTNMYNTLAASAFCLLVYNPYFLWDVGFQLSYTAVLSIVLFMKPVYKWMYFENKLLSSIWQLNSITLAAQPFTLPIILYYFHQFPNLFLFTNFIAVPLSGFILYSELLLLIFSSLPWLAPITGKLAAFLISQMNGFIERTDRLPYAVTGNLQVSLYQTILLYFTISCLAWWLLQKNIRGLLTGLGFLCCFTLLNCLIALSHTKQRKLIVYNIPKHSAIDIMEGRGYQCIADNGLLQNTGLQQFHLQPSRVMHGVKEAGTLENTFIHDGMIATSHKTILLINRPVDLPALQRKIPVDIIILSGNPKLWLSRLAAVFDCPQYVFDGSNPLWKIQYWKKDADSLHLRHHSTPEQGAFEVAL